MSFNYVAKDALGQVLRGTIDATSRDTATQMLRRDGMSVVKLEDSGAAEHLIPRRIKKSEIIYLTSQLAVMVDTGITLSDALGGIAEQAENPSLTKVLEELKHAVEGGESFSKALSLYPKHFDESYIALVSAAEETGTLAESLELIATYQRKSLDSRSKLRSALTYPAIMLVIAVAVTIFLLTFVMPKFAPLFNRKGMELPKSTQVMIAVSNAMIEYWYAWIAGAIASVVLFLVWRKTQSGRRSLDWLKIHLPVLGTLFRKITISRSIRTLGTMVGSGVSVLDSLRHSAEVAGNDHYRQSWLRVLNQVTNGRQICEALNEEKLFPKTLVQMIGSGEDTGKLAPVLEKVSVHYDREVETSLKTVTSLLEPLMITVMGVVVGGIGLSLLMPIFSLSSGM